MVQAFTLGILLGLRAGKALVGVPPTPSGAATPGPRLSSTQNPPDYAPLDVVQVYLEVRDDTPIQRVDFVVKDLASGVKYRGNDVSCAGVTRGPCVRSWSRKAEWAYAFGFSTTIPPSACGHTFRACATATYTSGTAADTATHQFALNSGRRS